MAVDYQITELSMRDGAIATLIFAPAAEAIPPRGAMLYVHGFVDYFFQDHVAEHFTTQGWTWYALDLRRNGRSLRDGDEPFSTNELTEYYEELDLAIARIKADGHDRIVLMGHSTGGLLSAIWAHARREQHPIDALILNSPWLDLQEPWFNREIMTWVLRGIGAVLPSMNAPKGLSGLYAQSVHADGNGEWQFNTDWKPLTAVPVKIGFIATVRREQARLHRGMDVGVPVLMLRSARSRLGLKAWEPAAQTADIVLDVEQMHHWLPKVGLDITEVALDGAVHDVMLSAAPVREKALAEIDRWSIRLDQDLARWEC